jgi:hypothetical protein
MAGPGPVFLTADGEALWHADWLVPGMLYKSDLGGNLLDYADAPFFESMADHFETLRIGVQGLAYDGENLWALDAKGKRICLIERAR